VLLINAGYIQGRNAQAAIDRVKDGSDACESLGPGWMAVPERVACCTLGPMTPQAASHACERSQRRTGDSLLDSA